MITQTSNREELLTAIGEAVSDMGGLMKSLSEEQVNAVPYEGSWTAGQLFSHVTKSINAMADALLNESQPAERDPAEKADGLKATFLNFSNKFQSPDFITPDAGTYQKQECIDALNRSYELLKENAVNANMSDLLQRLLLGEITKLELLHFVLYHTQRHLYQMKRITDALMTA